jgi:hypothetical protein
MAISERYEHRSPYDLLVPECYRVNGFLKVVQRLVSLTLGVVEPPPWETKK